jgi:trimethylamine--corrinoid protein Co-methyltransferase
MDAGLLSIDEICSPIQLVLDNELLAALQRFTTEFAVTEESIGLDTILSAGPGGSYLDTEHTVSLFRTEHWQPSIWSRQMLPQWLAAGAHLDSDRARDSIPDSVRAAAPIDPLPEQLDRELLSIIEAARHIRRG